MALSVTSAIEEQGLSGRLWLYSNYHCNLACDYCLTGSSPAARPRSLTPEFMLEAARQARALGFTGLGVTGGEPLLLPWLPETVARMSELLPVVLLTNGTLAAGVHLERLLSLAGCDVRLQISLDRPDPEENDRLRGQGNFKKVVEAIPRLVEAGLRVRVASSVMSQTDEEAERLRALIAGLGVAPGDHLVRMLVHRGRARARGHGLRAGVEELSPELTLAAHGAFWSPFGATVRAGRPEVDLLLTRTILPLSTPAAAMLEVLGGLPADREAAAGFT